jgi:ankyrin repeat protein
MKKLLVIILFVVLIALSSVALYLAYFAEKKAEKALSLAHMASYTANEATDGVKSLNFGLNYKASLTPLMITVKKGDIKKVRLLLKDRDIADISAKDILGRTALFHAVYSNQPEICKMLVKAGAEVNVRDKWGETLINEAVTAGLDEIVTILLDAGADINGKGRGGYTPLIDVIARRVDKNRIHTLELLIKRGADVNIKDYHQMSALDMLNNPPWYIIEQQPDNRAEKDKIISLLKHAGAKG